MFQGSKRRFGVTTNVSGINQGIVINNLQLGQNLQSAQARNEKGKLIDIAVFGDDKEISLDGLYTGQGVSVGTVIKINNTNFVVTSTGKNEINTGFQTSTINARYFSGEDPGPGPGPGPEPIIPNPSLSFKAVQNGGAAIQINQYGSPLAVNLLYRKNNQSWSIYNIGDVINLDKNDIVFLSGANDHFSTGQNDFYYFTIAGDVEASGNIQSLMNFSNNAKQMCYHYLFRNCDDLLTAPELPATGIAEGCYWGMFQYCTSLTDAPQLPATEIKYYQLCYGGMFFNCTSLTAAPQLPALEVGSNSYDYMFWGCTSLTTPPQLPATSLAYACYRDMFTDCTSLTAAPQLPATTLDRESYAGMFRNCEKISAITVALTGWGDDYLSATQNWVNGVALQGVFYKPAVLSAEYGDSRIPTLWGPVNKEQWSFPLSFKAVGGDTTIQLNQIAHDAPNIVLSYKENDGPWTSYNVGDPINLNENSIIYLSGANNQISFSDKYRFTITGQIEADGNIQSLMNYDYRCWGFAGLFKDCSGLLTPPQLLSPCIGGACYASMFQNCTSLSTAPQLPARFTKTSPTLFVQNNQYSSMFAGCTSLTDSPTIIEAPSNAHYIYSYSSMFAGCTSLTSVTVTFTNWGLYLGYLNWLSGVSPTGIFYKPSELSTIYKYPYDRDFYLIPSGWQVVKEYQPIPSSAPLTFRGLSSTNAVQLSAVGSPMTLVLDYSINDGNWTRYNTGNIIELNQGDTVAFSGVNSNYHLDDMYNRNQFIMTGQIEAGGNIQSLLNFSNSCNVACYWMLFNKCSSLVTPPHLPALTLASHCYDGMFNNCTGLTTAPQLPATQLVSDCYAQMFANCTSLSSAPELPATELSGIRNYFWMFAGCINLTDAPYLPATTLCGFCYTGMFANCSKLSSVSVNFTAWGDMNYWLSGVAANGIFTKPEALSEEYGQNRIPSGWLVQQFTTPEPEEPPPSEQV